MTGEVKEQLDQEIEGSKEGRELRFIRFACLDHLVRALQMTESDNLQRAAQEASPQVETEMALQTFPKRD